MLGFAAVLILHCRPTGSNPFHPSRRPLAAILPLFLRRVQLPIPLGLNLLLMPGEHVLRRHVTDRAVQPEIVVSVHILLNQAFCIFQRQRRPRSNAFAFQRLVPTFQLAIVLVREHLSVVWWYRPFFLTWLGTTFLIADWLLVPSRQGSESQSALVTFGPAFLIIALYDVIRHRFTWKQSNTKVHT